MGAERTRNTDERELLLSGPAPRELGDRKTAAKPIRTARWITRERVPLEVDMVRGKKMPLYATVDRPTDRRDVRKLLRVGRH